MPNNNVRTRQAISKLKQATRDLDRQIDKINAANKRVVNEYNRFVHEHNTRVRTNQQHLQQELRRFNAHPTTVTYRVTHRSSVQTLVQSFSRIEQSSELGTWQVGNDILDLAERETANSVAVLTALSTWS